MNGNKTVACLAGDGVGPELMAEATRLLSELCALHSVAIDEEHLPFAGEAVTRFGHPLPLSTRTAYRQADAILVAAPHEPALEAIKADLDLAWRVSRVHLHPSSELLVFGAVGSASPEPAIRRAFFSAASKHGCLTAVGTSPEWRKSLAAEHERWAAMDVEHKTIGELLVGLGSPSRLDVVVTEAELVEPITDAAAHLGGSPATVAHAWLAEEGPGLFVPGFGESSDNAGFGVADPTAMLLTVSLLLAEGLQRRSAARTLERAVSAAGSCSETRTFTDAVIELLAEARTDVEHFEEIWT